MYLLKMTILPRMTYASAQSISERSKGADLIYDFRFLSWIYDVDWRFRLAIYDFDWRFLILVQESSMYLLKMIIPGRLLYASAQSIS
jgi:hypothetical protein